MTWQTVTALLMVAITVILIGYDLIAYSIGGNAAIISQVCLRTAEQHRGFVILVGFAVGVLFGHLFLPQHVGK